MKKLFLLYSLAIIFAGCSASVEIVNLSADEKLKHGISLMEDESYEEAYNVFQAIVLQHPGSAVVDDAQFYLAKSKFEKGEYIIAAYEFSKLIRNMPASEFIPEAQFMLAECYYLLSPHYALEQKYTKSAIKEYQAFVDVFPAHEKVPEAEMKIKELNEKLALKEYNNAVIYEKLEYYNAAIMYFTNVEETYHDTQFAPMALYRKIKLLIERNDNSRALSEVSKFLQKYPNDSNVKEITAIKASLENKISASK